MLFNEVIGQEALKQHLTEMVAQNRLSHALLFVGADGVGALPLAISFAQYIVSLPNEEIAKGDDLFGAAPTENTQTTIAPNDIANLPAYQRANQLIHPDLHFSFPCFAEKPGAKNFSSNWMPEWREFLQINPYGNVYDWLQSINVENKQGNISADECNDIIRKLNFKSFESKYKVLVMWMPEYLGKEGNILLKLIEEPPANTIFILVANNEEQILPTILSRCQLIAVPRLKKEAIESALIERAKLDPSNANQIALLANGSYREAQHLLQHSDEDYIGLVREWLNAILKNGPVAQVKWTEEMSKMGREGQKQFLLFFNHLIEQSIRIKIMGSQLAIDDSLRDFALRINKIASIGQLEAMIEEIDKSIYHIERNANPKMLFTALGIKFFHIIQMKTLILT